MLSKLLSTSAALLLSARLASAQTFSSCNPVKGQTCPADPAFGGTYTIDFTKGASEYFTVAAGTTLSYDDSKGAAFTISKETDAPTITSTKYLFFGSVEVVTQAAPGTGIVSSFVLESDDLDEIDWEWLGGDTTHVQTNYFSKGNTTTYDRGGFSSVSSPQTTFHTYKVDWSPEAIVWSIDGTTVRTLTWADANNGATFPQTPMQIKLGTWDGGASTSPKGTVEWAGGYTPFGSGSGAPYVAYYKSITVVDRSNGVSGATSYSYSGTSGDYTSIVVHTADGNVTSSGSSTGSTTSSTTKTSETSKTSATGTVTGTVTGTTKSTAASTTLVVSTTSTAGKNSSSASTATPSSGTAAPTSGVSKIAANLAGIAGAAMAVFALL